MKNLAIIPARSGSKGLKDKNILPLAGKPLIAYSIEAAKESGQFEEIMVSTDSERYAQTAREWGASVPFLRSEATATDTASSWDAVREVLEGYRRLGRSFDSVCLLQPTSPLRTAEDIRGAYELYRKVARVAVVSVCEADHSPLWCNHLPEDQSLAGFIPRAADAPRQKAGKYYRLNGAVYIVETGALLEDDFLYRKGSYAYIMPREHSVDIDTAEDFRLASFYLGCRQPQGTECQT